MIRLRTGYAARLVSVGLVFAMYLLPGMGSAAALAARQPRPAPQPLLTLGVLPFDNKAQAGGDTLGRDLAVALKTALEGSGKFYLIGFSDRLPSIQRAIAEGAISKRDAEGPFAGDKTLAARVGRAMGAEAVVVGSVDEVKVDVPGGAAEVTASVDVIDVQSGNVLRSAVLSGKNPTKPEGADESALVSLAAGDLAAKTAADIVTESSQGKLSTLIKPVPSAEPAKKKSKKSSWLLIALVLAAVGIAISGGGGDGGSNGGDDLPPNP